MAFFLRIPFAFAVLALIVACTTDLPNLQVVEPGLLVRSGQPSDRGLEYLRDTYGIQTVIDLNPWFDEREHALALGLDYVSLYQDTYLVDQDYFVQILAVLRQAQLAKRTPVLVHCRTGQDRAGTAVAVFRTVEQGWSADQAVAEMEHYRHWSRRIIYPSLPEIAANASEFRSIWQKAVDRTGAISIVRPEQPWSPNKRPLKGAVSDARFVPTIGVNPTLF